MPVRQSRKRDAGRKRLPAWFVMAEVSASCLMVAGLVMGAPNGPLFIAAAGFIGSNAGIVLSWIRSGED